MFAAIGLLALGEVVVGLFFETLKLFVCARHVLGISFYRTIDLMSMLLADRC